MENNRVFYLNTVVALLFLVCYIIHVHTREAVANKFIEVEAKSGCELPVSYKIGIIDPRFNLTQEELRQAVTRAEKSWEKSLGRNLFDFNQESEVTLNLVYDERQALIDKIKEIELRLNDNRKRTMTPQFKGFMGDLSNLIRLQNQKALEHEKRLKDFLVDGLTEEEVRFLEAQERELERIDQLIEENRIFLDTISPYIIGIEEEYAALLTSYQSLQKIRKGLHVAGTYDRSQKRVEIYMFWEENDLVSTIAHELGHAMGLGHTKTPDALMNEIGGKDITPADLALIPPQCR